MSHESQAHRLHLKLPNGAELEAEGPLDFVTGERREFISLQGGRPPAAEGGIPPSRTAPEEGPLVAWETILEAKGDSIQLRSKLRGERTEKDACLVLLAASQIILRNPKPTSSQLAKWLRASGYPISRVDRLLQEALDQGEILASGSRRARRYELSGPGRVKALILAARMTSWIRGSGSMP
ncbi:MAG TPA: hypothetical protein DCM05_08780 [Elusimicrobia bacterium]|nr:hypothetical protein [Elusimicrobiota bacterium]